MPKYDVSQVPEHLCRQWVELTALRDDGQGDGGLHDSIRRAATVKTQEQLDAEIGAYVRECAWDMNAVNLEQLQHLARQSQRAPRCRSRELACKIADLLQDNLLPAHEDIPALTITGPDVLQLRKYVEEWRKLK